MNILSDDGHQLVERLNSWEEMYSRVRFQTDIDPSSVTILRILSNYVMQEDGACGLTTCHRAHKKGYLVLCKGGIETNIGNICGVKIFGHSFEEHEQTYKRDINTIRYRDAIVEQQCNIEATRSKIKNMLTAGNGNKAYAAVRDIHVKFVFVGGSATKLKRRSEKTDNLLTEVRYATEDEINREEVRLNKKLSDKEKEELTVSYDIGRITGIRAFTTYVKIKNVLIIDVPKLLNELSEVKAEELNYKQLETWSKRLDNLDGNINEIEEVIDDCIRFSNPQNIQFIKDNETLL